MRFTNPGVRQPDPQPENSRRFDAVMAGMDITPEREKQVLFTHAAYCTTTPRALFVGQRGKYTSVGESTERQESRRTERYLRRTGFIMDKHPEITTVP